MRTPAKGLANLFSFMRLFHTRAFEIIDDGPQRARVRVWTPDICSPELDTEEDEWQELEWDVVTGAEVDDAIEIVHRILDDDLIVSDVIQVSDLELQRRLGWPDERFWPALEALLEFRVEMIDDGERTDHFFVHF